MGGTSTGDGELIRTASGSSWYALVAQRRAREHGDERAHPVCRTARRRRSRFLDGLPRERWRWRPLDRRPPRSAAVARGGDYIDRPSTPRTSSSARRLVLVAREITRPRSTQDQRRPQTCPRRRWSDWMGTGRAPRRVRISSMAPEVKRPRDPSVDEGDARRIEHLHRPGATVSDCGSTPETPSNTTTAPSSTQAAASTSIVKSTWPGVSMRCSS